MRFAVVSFALAILSLAGLIPSSAEAQKQLASEDQLTKDYEAKQRRFYELSTGGAECTKADEPVVKAGARYLVYRVALPTHWNKQNYLSGIVKTYETTVRGLIGTSSEAKQARFRHDLAKELIPCLQEVLALDLQENQPAVINAGLMLPALGHTGEKSAGNFLAAQARNAPNDVVRLFAFKGLHEYFQARPATVDPLAENEARKEEIDRIEPLIAFITTKAKLTDSSSPEELDAYRFVRREAIKALAETRVPAIPLLPGVNGDIKASVAHTLLRVLSDGKNALSPPASLSERFEAALGLCKIRSKLVPRYQPQLAVALVGKFLVDFSQTYNADWAQFGAKNIREPKIPLLPWKVHADLMREGLKEFAANTPAGEAQKQVLELQKNTEPILTDMRRLNQVSFDLLKAAVRGLPRPTSSEVYSKVAASQIDLRWPPFSD